jgi:hypothetical protein
MDRIESHDQQHMIVTRRILVKRDPAWPRYQLVCGQLKRLLSPDSEIEELGVNGWVREKHHI